jgi:hypothetical protein
MIGESVHTLSNTLPCIHHTHHLVDRADFTGDSGFFYPNTIGSRCAEHGGSRMALV